MDMRRSLLVSGVGSADPRTSPTLPLGDPSDLSEEGQLRAPWRQTAGTAAGGSVVRAATAAGAREGTAAFGASATADVGVRKASRNML
ncbi:hypothetical protein GCM10017744_019920 [Streptomyces antimycoticus]